MKLVSALTYTAQDIRDQLAIATLDLKVARTLPNGKFSLRLLKEGAQTHVYLFDEEESKFVGVATFQKDKLPRAQHAVRGACLMQAGLLKEYRGVGYLWRVISMIADVNVVLASQQTTQKGMQMWLKRIKFDNKHAYLAYNPQGFGVMNGEQMMPLRPNNYSGRVKSVWDGSLQTRLLCLPHKHPIIKRFNVDMKNG